MPRRVRDAYLRNRRPTKQLRLDNTGSKDEEKEYLKKYRWMLKYQNIKENQKNDTSTKKSY